MHINKEATNIQVYSIDLEDEPFAAYISGYIITYASEEVLFENLREFIQDDEQDEDMISQYTSIYNAIENGNQTTGKQKSSNNLQYQNYLTN